MMVIQPHPIVKVAMARQRRKDLQIQADHYRLGRLARADDEWLRPRIDFAGIAAIVPVATLPCVASLRYRLRSS
jgi:hypothetical protein